MTVSTFRPAARSAAFAVLLALGLLGGPLGCAFGEWRLHDPFGREITLEDAQHRYSVLVRWSSFEEAAKFVAEDSRSDFLAAVPNFREMRFTEYESDQPEIDPDTGDATIEVTYFAYSLRTPLEIKVHETQHWSRTGLRNTWQVRPTFRGLPDSPKGSASLR